MYYLKYMITTLNHKNVFDIVFIPTSMYHYKTMELIADQLTKINVSFCFININSNVDFLQNKLKYQKYFYSSKKLLSGKIMSKLLFFMNTVTGDTSKIKELALKSNLYTVALVEGPVYNAYDKQNFNEFGISKWYNDIDLLLTTCDEDKNIFSKSKSFLTVGVPRFEELCKSEAIFPEEDLILISSNFGWHHQPKGDKWVKQVVQACKELNIDFILNTHPADNNIYEVVKSENSLIDDIKSSSLVITRESSVIFEALCLGKPIVFHNIYDYQGNFLLEPLGAYSISSNIKDLKNAIKNEIKRKSQIKKIGRNFLEDRIYFDKNISAIDKIVTRLNSELKLNEYISIQSFIDYQRNRFIKILKKTAINLRDKISL